MVNASLVCIHLNVNAVEIVKSSCAMRLESSKRKRKNVSLPSTVEYSLAMGPCKTVMCGSSRSFATKMINNREPSPKLKIIQRDVGTDELISSNSRWLIVPVFLAA
jgi:hypothetical protein